MFVTCAREIRKVYTKFPKKAHELLKTFRFEVLCLYKILSQLYANFSALLDWRLPEKNARLKITRIQIYLPVLALMEPKNLVPFPKKIIFHSMITPN